MRLCKEVGLNVCHSSDKIEDKHGNSFLPQGFHPLATCIGKNGSKKSKNQSKEAGKFVVPKGECIIHSIFGSLRQKSKISFYCPPVSNISHVTAETEYPVQNVQLAMENRHVSGFDGKGIQDLSEKFFSGEFYFEVEVSQLFEEELGLLMEAVARVRKLGRGLTAGTEGSNP